ncbi:hypothetical protein [Lichenibacterium dinghuense]|uniref:hypothetical protein n=1 Tax=Lichenibacterium dinghuense TaxID=2895977 RepID=UPI001F30E6CD|nr:hypothetical protein [Lichenibacterium sp. 6Y81]
MIDRAWLTVFKTLAGIIGSSQPYDASGGFLLLHSIDATLESRELGGSHAAARHHLMATLDARADRLEAARRSMVRICFELESLLQSTA